ncbi:hypothetical protein [Actinomadura montaniterrae]|uniref:IS110 family transposase n=1 Tax=Actinomadura montaniterrae TaxID=1803903 RepID=A0A6L3VR02_9ACTN|nr:hypothetical protein [Actinomadura montaniterrae]KAB2379250.1 hypothetical protein F9B16_21290 [Actinomadura montaniterrae]
MEAQALRTLQVVKRGAIKARTSAINAIRSVPVSASDELRDRSRNVRKSDLIEHCLRLRLGTDGPDASVKKALRRLARCCKMLNEERADVDAVIDVLVHRCAPALLELDAIGPGIAVTLLVTAGDNPQHLRSEAS